MMYSSSVMIINVCFQIFCKPILLIINTVTLTSLHLNRFMKLDLYVCCHSSTCTLWAPSNVLNSLYAVYSRCRLCCWLHLVWQHVTWTLFLSPGIQTNGLDFQRQMVPTTSAITNAHAQALLQQVTHDWMHTSASKICFCLVLWIEQMSYSL